MHNGYMHDGWGGGSWGWIAMAAFMVLFWGGVIWVGISLIRRTAQVAPSHAGATTPTPVATPPPPNPQDVLAERLARGDIDLEDYRQRLEALRQGRSG